MERLGPLAAEHDRYRPERLVGEGGFGAVYAARDVKTGAELALKVLHRSDPEAIYRFRQEFRRLVSVSHPNVMPHLELEEFQGVHFLTMPLLRGAESLAWLAKVPEEGREEALRRLFRDVGAGLEALHAQGVLHRDIKPSNIFVTEEGQALLLDFGLAHAVGVRVDENVMGSIAYMAPEQVDRLDEVGPASDWYGVGAVLYEALTGRPPFRGDAPLQVLVEKVQTPPPPVQALASDAPEDLAELANGLLAIDPRDRPGLAEIRQVLDLPPRPETSAPLAFSGSRLPKFLARKAFLDELTAVALDTGRGPRACLLAGDAGMGKTTVIDVLRHRVEQSPRGIFLGGQCGQGEAVPFKGVDSLVDALAGVIKALPDKDVQATIPAHLDELLRVFPTLQRASHLARRPRALSDAGLNRWEMRRRAAAGLRDLLARVARGRTLTICVDDLHWIDRDGAELLALLFDGEGPPPPAFFLFTFRDEQLSEAPAIEHLWEAVGASGTPLTRKHLAPLGHDEAAGIVRSLVGAISPETRERVIQETAGNPLYLVALARDAATSSPEAPAAERERGPGTPGPAEAPSRPEGVGLQAMLTRRFAALDQGAYEVLGLLALADTPLTLETLALATEHGENPAFAARALRAVRLIRGGFGERPAELDHRLIREAFRASVPRDTARALHRHLAVALEAQGAPAAQIAAHHRGAGATRQEAEFTLRAAREAAHVLAFDRAATLFARAIELRQELGDDTRALHVQRAEVFIAAQRGLDAARALLRAADEGAGAEASVLRLRAAEQLLVSGHVDEGYALLNEVLPDFHLSATSGRLRALLGVAVERARLWTRRRRLGHLVQRLRTERTVPPQLLEQIDATLALGRSIAMLDSLRAAQVNTRATRLALQAREGHRLQQALVLEISFAAGTGSSKARHAAEHLDTLRALNAVLDTKVGPGLEAMSEGLLRALGRGDWAGARPYFAQGRRRLRATTKSLEADVCENFEMVAAGLMGDFQWLHPTLLKRLEDAERRGDIYQVVSLTCDGSHLSWLARDKPDELLARVREVMTGWKRDRFLLPRYWELWARTRAALYRPGADEDLSCLDDGWREIQRAGLLYSEAVAVDLWATRGLAALARWARGEGDARPHRRLAGKAAQQLARAGHPNAPLRGRLLRAGLSAATGRPEDARAALEGLGEAFSELQWHLHAAAAQLRLGQLVGGRDGDARAAQAREDLRGLGVVDPDAMARVVAPEVGLA